MISGFGPHLSGTVGLGGDDSLIIGITVANWVFNGFESPNDAIINDSLSVSWYNSSGGISRYSWGLDMQREGKLRVLILLFLMVSRGQER